MWKLASTNRILWSVLAPATNKISDNIYPNCPRHCNNGGPQVKGFGFDQYSSLVLAVPTLWIIIDITATYYLIIGILDVKNAFQDTFKDSSKREIIDCPPHYISWFKFHFPNIHIEPASDDLYVMEIYRGMQGTKPAGSQWNNIINLVLYSLGFIKNLIDYALFTLQKNSTKYVIIVGYSTYEFLFDHSSIHIFKYFFAGLNKYFVVTSNECSKLSYINLRIIKYPYRISIDQTYHIQNTILAQWFPDASEKVNSDPTPSRQTAPLNLI